MARFGHAPKLTMLRRAAIVAGIWIVGVACLGVATLWLGGNSALSALRATILERIGGETPQVKVNAYVRAILRGDEEDALATWALPERELPGGRSDALRRRREAVTQQLIDAELDQEYRIEHIEWWRTCCEPWVTDSERDAGGARVQVQFLDREGMPRVYVFDVFTRGGAYWGGAMGYPLRHWALYDVYPNGEEPLYWRLVYEPAVRGLPWPPEETQN